MFLLKIYFFIALMNYIFLGLYLIKKNQLQPITLISLLIYSIFWLPFSIYAILTDERE